MHQQKVRAFYRKVMRAVYDIPDPMRSDLRNYVRDEFKKTNVPDSLDDQKYLLSLGENQFQSMRPTLEGLKAR